jgi:hypothetical protein
MYLTGLWMPNRGSLPSGGGVIEYYPARLASGRAFPPFVSRSPSIARPRDRRAHPAIPRTEHDMVVAPENDVVVRVRLHSHSIIGDNVQATVRMCLPVTRAVSLTPGLERGGGLRAIVS